ncbi:hypothetical protein [Nocardia vinacea]|uniref:hypothetical protein n=1 Tax=Nocardia vinacea TaxID=96468 RepID=UPI0002E41F8F|nr:hypothetical protein [Nocardia vinacea]
MTTFLGELSKKLAERWLTLLVLPGLLWCGAVIAAAVLGQRSALDLHAADAWINSLANRTSGQRPTVAAITVATLLGAAAVVGLIADWLGTLVDRVWTAHGTSWATRWLAQRRTNRWDKAFDEFERSIAGSATDPGSSAVARARARCMAISPVRAARPMWIGDRLQAADKRVHEKYGIDLSPTWPRLWTVLPDSARSDLATALDSYAAAARLVGWGLLYLVVTPWWWPAAPIGGAVVFRGWRCGRSAAQVLAELTETTVDLYGPTLARQFGIDCNGLLTTDIGNRVSEIARKDSTFYSHRQPRPPET